MDFFYDGGKMMRPEPEGVRENMEGILETLAPFKPYDFILLQEVDTDSRRSYNVDQVDAITMNFPSHQVHYTMNYDVFFVPLPLSTPMGKVKSGLLSLSRHVPRSVERRAFPGNYSWPVKLFMLDRCFLVKRFPVEGGSELLVLNTHNSAYDDGSLRMQQMDFLRDFLLKEYRKGNYVIVGGDWNQTPHGFSPELLVHRFDTINLVYVPEDFPEAGWTWAYDPAMSTNRRVTVPYDRDSSLTTVIDYYLLSPNIDLLEVATLDVDFRYSDHQPVRLKVKLQP
jgi:endonuclease/exonuclease/phosphatase family metal-dependent hydrolase